MNKSLENKIALVTGSSRGIGAAIAKKLAGEGAAVLVHYGNSKGRAEEVVAEIRKSGGEADVVGADLTKTDGAATLIPQIDKAFGGKYAGRLDILVNNAGTADFGPVTEATDESFDKQYNLNVRSLFQLSREGAQRMSKAKWGRIINIGSCLGEAVRFPGIAIYSSTKFAVQGLTRAMSRDLGPAGITVNNVQPGPIDTELNPASGEGAASQIQLTSVGRYGKAEEIAEAVAFLAGPGAAYINGESITVDGGVNA